MQIKYYATCIRQYDIHSTYKLTICMNYLSQCCMFKIIQLTHINKHTIFLTEMHSVN